LLQPALVAAVVVVAVAAMVARGKSFFLNEKGDKRMKQESTLEIQQADEKLQNLDNVLQQLEVQTFEIEDVADTRAIMAGTCSSTTSSCCSGVK